VGVKQGWSMVPGHSACLACTSTTKQNFLKEVMVLSSNPRYLGGKDQENLGSRPDWGKS
jgi:hypothetical protein